MITAQRRGHSIEIHEDGVLTVLPFPKPVRAAPDFAGVPHVPVPPEAKPSRWRRAERRVLMWLRDAIDKRLFK